MIVFFDCFGFFVLIVLVVGLMIGVGIFLLL